MAIEKIFRPSSYLISLSRDFVLRLRARRQILGFQIATSEDKQRLRPLGPIDSLQMTFEDESSHQSTKNLEAGDGGEHRAGCSNVSGEIGDVQREV